MSEFIPPWDEPGHRCHPDIPQEEAGTLSPCDRCRRFHKARRDGRKHEQRKQAATETKTCNACMRELPLIKFEPTYDKKRAPDARRATCTACHGYVKTDAQLVDQIAAGGEHLLAVTQTAKQRELAETIVDARNVVVASERCDMQPAQARAQIKNMIQRAAESGYSPAHDITHPIPPGYRLRGTSTLYDSDGQIAQQWHKTERAQTDEFEELRKAIADLIEPWPADLKPAATPSPMECLDDLLCVYPMGDPHLGMLAWAPETGESFDLAIAERQLYAAADHLVHLAPPAKHGLLINAGDFFHADNDKGTTFAGTPVDVDGRQSKVYSVGLRLMRRLVERMLTKHEHVTVINEIGNHDRSVSVLLAIALAELFSKEPRVHIDTSPQPFHYYRFGDCLIATHHGDQVKTQELPQIMACDLARDWGETVHRHWYVGHVHHDTVKELRGCTVETLRTLAAKDKWHHGQGYRSGRDMKMDVWHRTFGRRGRQIVDIALVRALTENPYD
jgi:hypothetical protein